ncbi:DUF3631 domain-containing protein [Cryobacterium sp. 10I5]|uniref:DUF3631 domain-containing protein n=1 Tax=Cryobacterium sp. 10I5 TaxID=3048581 RepID=UPI002B234A54|nr:DUF3631 domain-containing protein [Cryobacterium sp. 10I5]MEB0264363.1 DUF3631 domain-containing protein [Cryobacterium sp. 10I5]
MSAVGSVGSVGSVDSMERVLDDVRGWLARFVCVMEDRDLDLLTLWAAHTHLCFETYSTPRLVLDSPMHGSGKTTVLEHLSRLCLNPVQAASLSSPALLTRMLNAGMRTILIDEVDRSLDPKKPGVEDLIAVLNSGYKRGATRPVLVPAKGGTWEVSEMSTFSPVAMAGNAPALPDDTRSRCIRVLLLPDLEGVVESSDWEEIDEDAQALGARLAAAAEVVRETVRSARPSIPEGTIGRIKERWYPIKRVASSAGEKWASIADELIVRDIEATAMDKEDGIANVPPAVSLIRDVYAAWPDDAGFIATTDLVSRLIRHNPLMWSSESFFGKDLTVQRLGRMMVTGFKIHSQRQGDSARGYHRATLAAAWRRMGVTPRIQTDGTAKTDGTDGMQLSHPSQVTNEAEGLACRVCSRPLMAPQSRAVGICGMRDDDHQAARQAVAA